MKLSLLIAAVACATVLQTTNGAPPNVAAWGQNSYGQCNVPADLTNTVMLAADGYFCAAVRSDGTVTAWGDNSSGQRNVPAAATNIVGLGCGGGHVLALRRDGKVLAWGDNSSGQCNVPAGLTNAMAVSADGNLSLGLRVDGVVFAWGDNAFGHLNVPADLTNAIGIAAGYVMGAALKADRTVVTWGWGGTSTPTPPQATNVIAIAAGAYQVLALRADKTVVTWGGNNYGELNVPSGCTNIVAISAVNTYSMALREDGTVLVWGDCSYGACNVPAGLTNVIGIRAGGYNALALIGPNCVSPPSGLISWWPAEGDARDIISGNSGVLVNGTSFAPGKVGQAFVFNGINQVLQVADSPSLNPTNGLTLEGWVYVQAFSANNAVSVAGKDNPYANRQYLLAMDTVVTNWVFRAHVGVPSGFQNFNGTRPLQLQTWYHVAMTYDGSSLRLYVNGALDGSMAVTGPIITSTDPLLIGGSVPGPWNFNGRVDELSLYGRALSATEIAGIYNAGSAGKCSCIPHPATATAEVVNGFVVGATIIDGGCGYTNAPAVLIQGGGGSGATATAVVSNGVVTGITITGAGIGYTNTPTVYLYSPLALQVGLVKAVKPSFVNLSPGFPYQLQVSGDLTTWTNSGSAFTATNTSMIYSQYWDVDNWGKLFFRLQASP